MDMIHLMAGVSMENPGELAGVEKRLDGEIRSREAEYPGDGWKAAKGAPGAAAAEGFLSGIARRVNGFIG
jgi:hypothetical protein